MRFRSESHAGVGARSSDDDGPAPAVPSPGREGQGEGGRNLLPQGLILTAALPGKNDLTVTAAAGRFAAVNCNLNLLLSNALLTGAAVGF